MGARVLVHVCHDPRQQGGCGAGAAERRPAETAAGVRRAVDDVAVVDRRGVQRDVRQLDDGRSRTGSQPRRRPARKAAARTATDRLRPPRRRRSTRPRDGRPTASGAACVPPTPVANGWAAGSSTASTGNPEQSNEPESPDAASTVMPETAASWRAWLVAATLAGAINGSHTPQLSDTIRTPVTGASATIAFSIAGSDVVGGAM